MGKGYYGLAQQLFIHPAFWSKTTLRMLAEAYFSADPDDSILPLQLEITHLTVVAPSAIVAPSPHYLSVIIVSKLVRRRMKRRAEMAMEMLHY